MAPPTANDPWLAGRHFGIVIDAGSSGSRLQIYSWLDPRGRRPDKGSAQAYALPKVEIGTKDEESWVTKVEPGLSTLASNPTAVGTYLKPLVTHALNEIPPSLHSSTPIFLLATAGMRLLSPQEQASVLSHACEFLRSSTKFKIDAPSASLGPCGSSVRIITGEEEGLFGWIAVNYLMDGFTGRKGKGKEVDNHSRTTYGFLDMGGASTQIAFEPSAEHERGVKGKGLMDVRLRLLGGEEIRHKVFVTTWLGYGTNQARERYVGQAIKELEGTRAGNKGHDDIVLDPCLPKGFESTESPVYIGTAGGNTQVDPHTKQSHKLLGTGSFEQCLRNTEPLLNTNKPCPDAPCLMNGIHVPSIDFSVSHFIGVSEYWYSSEHIFGLGGAYDFVQYERAASQFCGRDWAGILKQHEESRKNHQLGGDGEVIKDDQIVEVGAWGPEVELPRLQMQCFKAAWIVNVLHKGLGMPRTVDSGGNSTTSGDRVVEAAEEKGLGRPPTFQSMDAVGHIAISWTLGKMVLEASKEVPPLRKGDKPLVDPIDDIEDYNDSPVKPIRPPFFSLDAIEDKLTPHLPPSLTRESLGFSPVLPLFWMIVFFVLFLVVYPFRRQFRTGCLRFVRGKREAYGDIMEEGRMVNGGGMSPSGTSPAASWMRRVFPRSGSTRNGNGHPLPHLRSSGLSKATMPRSFSMPTITTSGVGDNLEEGGATVVSSTRYNIPRTPSPAPGTIAESGDGQMLTSRSRNTSQANLSILAQRPAGATFRRDD